MELTMELVVELVVGLVVGPPSFPSCHRRHRGPPPLTVLAVLVVLEVLVVLVAPRAPVRSKLQRWKAVGKLALLLALLGAGSWEEVSWALASPEHWPAKAVLLAMPARTALSASPDGA